MHFIHTEFILKNIINFRFEKIPLNFKDTVFVLPILNAFEIKM